MKLTEAVLLGLVQGLTEFLPVSSSGHLVVLQHFLRVPGADVVFDVFLHLATVLAVVLYFRKDLWELRRKPRLVWLLIVGSVPAGAAGFLLKDFFEGLYSTIGTIGFEFIITGFILWGADLLAKRYQRKRAEEDLTTTDAWWIGVGQAVAIIPAISRSGATIAAGLARGLERDVAARFSFLLSVPVILGAGALEARHLTSIAAGASLPLVAGFLASFLAGLVAIRVLLDVVRRRGLSLFAWYVWILGAALVVYNLLAR